MMRAVVLAVVLAFVTLACASTTLIAAGSAAPDFAAKDQTGATRTRADWAGKPLVLFFYPKDGSPGCTKEACAFRNVWQKYEEKGVAVVGVSTDDVAAHKAFADEHKLPFPLLADTDGVVMKAYGVDSTFGLAARVTILVDSDGTVAKVWRDVDPGVHADEVLAAVAPAALLPPPPG